MRCTCCTCARRYTYRGSLFHKQPKRRTRHPTADSTKRQQPRPRIANSTLTHCEKLAEELRRCHKVSAESMSDVFPVARTLQIGFSNGNSPKDQAVSM